MDEPAIRIEALSKTYAGGKRALNEVSFDVPRGRIFGLLGPNGAGKSTLINILAGLVVKTGGGVTIWGFDIDEHDMAAIERMDEHHRIPFVMREVEDRTYEEIAEQIGIPVGTVKSRLNRARNSFARIISPVLD